MSILNYSWLQSGQGHMENAITRGQICTVILRIHSENHLLKSIVLPNEGYHFYFWLIFKLRCYVDLMCNILSQSRSWQSWFRRNDAGVSKLCPRLPPPSSLPPCLSFLSCPFLFLSFFPFLTCSLNDLIHFYRLSSFPPPKINIPGTWLYSLYWQLEWQLEWAGGLGK